MQLRKKSICQWINVVLVNIPSKKKTRAIIIIGISGTITIKLREAIRMERRRNITITITVTICFFLLHFSALIILIYYTKSRKRLNKNFLEQSNFLGKRFCIQLKYNHDKWIKTDGFGSWWLRRWPLEEMWSRTAETSVNERPPIDPNNSKHQ